MKEVHELGSGVLQPLMIGAAFRPGKTAADDVITLMFPFGAFEIDISSAQALHNALGVALGIRAHAENLVSGGSQPAGGGSDGTG